MADTCTFIQSGTFSHSASSDSMSSSMIIIAFVLSLTILYLPNLIVESRVEQNPPRHIRHLGGL